MKISKLKKVLLYKSLFISLFLGQKAFSYTEGLVTASGVFFPENDSNSGSINPFYGWNVKADVMNNNGFDFGLGHTWSAGYRWVDLRTIYWWEQRQYGFYFGIQAHIQYYLGFGTGAGFNFGYSLPLTEYINATFDGDVGYGSSSFWRAPSDPFYYTASAGLSVSLW